MPGDPIVAYLVIAGVATPAAGVVYIIVRKIAQALAYRDINHGTILPLRNEPPVDGGDYLRSDGAAVIDMIHGRQN